MTALDNRAEWWSRAACSAADPELFFPISSAGPAAVHLAQAKAICARCEIRQRCLDYAVSTGPIQGVWGGMTEHERRLLRQGRRTARVHLSPARATGRPLARQAVT
jgi:WhiB family transcriptional regulator, redox-sensing transcriptional regulator